MKNLNETILPKDSPKKSDGLKNPNIKKKDDDVISPQKKKEDDKSIQPKK